MLAAFGCNVGSLGSFGSFVSCKSNEALRVCTEEVAFTMFESFVALLHWFFDVFVHLDVHLVQWADVLGPWLYVLLFAVVFCETGLVVTPFLPGDSLLFAVGALAALDGSPVNIFALWLVLLVAGVCGDAVNYAIGHYFGPKVFSRQKSWFLNTNHLAKTQRFYEKHGGKTIVIARFMPIVRTFAPFVAGIGSMRYRRFVVFNIAGATAWVSMFLVAGYAFGNLPSVKQHFQLVIFAIIFLSLLPIVVEFLRSRRRASEVSVRPANNVERRKDGGDGCDGCSTCEIC
jgi:membrane-associated protein